MNNMLNQVKNMNMLNQVKNMNMLNQVKNMNMLNQVKNMNMISQMKNMNMNMLNQVKNKIGHYYHDHDDDEEDEDSIDQLWSVLTSQVFSLATGEQLMAILPVTKLRRGIKPKTRVIAVTVKAKERKNSVRLFNLKKEAHSSGYNIIRKYKLRQLRRIDVEDDTVVMTFTGNVNMHIESTDDDQRNAFLWKIIQLSKDNFGVLPEMSGINIQELSMYADDDFGITGGEAGRGSGAAGGGSGLPLKELVTPEEEEYITMLLARFGFEAEHIRDAKAFGEQLARELSELEKANIYNILECQPQWHEIIDQLDIAADKLQDMELWLDSYSSQLENMQKDIEEFEAQNNTMEIQARNHQRLAEELDNLLNTLELPRQHVVALKSAPFDTESGLSSIIAAVHDLEEGLEHRFKDGMDKMLAVGERVEYFQRLRAELVQRFKVFLMKRFETLSAELLADKTRFSRKRYLKWEPHTPVFEDLERFQPLMKSVKATELKSHFELRESYTTAMKIVYKKELHTYFLEILSMIKKDKESSTNNQFLIGSTDTLSDRLIAMIHYAGSTLGSRASVNLESSRDPGGDYESDYDDEDDDMTSTSTSSRARGSVRLSRRFDEDTTAVASTGAGSLRVDRGFAALLNKVVDVVFREHKFCAQFFDIDPQIELQQKNFHELTKLQQRLFKHLPRHIGMLLEHIDKHTDRYYAIVMLLLIESKITSFSTRSAYIAQMLNDMKTKMELTFTQFIDAQIASIEQYTCTIKKTNIVPFIAKFPFFLDRFDIMLKDFEDTAHADSECQRIVTKMFECIDKLAELDPKHSNAFRLKNYMHYYRIVGKRSYLSPALQSTVKRAEQQMRECMHEYTVWLVKERFHDLWVFFEGIEECLTTRTIEAQDIHFQLQYSKDKLKDIVKFANNNMEKGIKDILKRMEKHIPARIDLNSYFKPSAPHQADYKLFAEIWSHLREYILSRYKAFEVIVGKCYLNQQLTPTSEQVKLAFRKLEDANKAKVSF